MLTFLLSILHTCFFHTSDAVRMITGIVFAFLAATILVVLYMDWGANPFTGPTIRGTILASLRSRGYFFSTCHIVPSLRSFRRSRDRSPADDCA